MDALLNATRFVVLQPPEDQSESIPMVSDFYLGYRESTYEPSGLAVWVGEDATWITEPKAIAEWFAGFKGYLRSEEVELEDAEIG